MYSVLFNISIELVISKTIFFYFWKFHFAGFQIFLFVLLVAVFPSMIFNFLFFLANLMCLGSICIIPLYEVQTNSTLHVFLMLILIHGDLFSCIGCNFLLWANAWWKGRKYLCVEILCGPFWEWVPSQKSYIFSSRPLGV